MNMKTEQRWPAEWEPSRAVLMAWPHADTDWAYMLDEGQDRISRIAMAISARARVVMVAPDIDEPRRFLADRGADMSRFMLVQLPTNDTWARDFGPITTYDACGRLVINDFQFNGWGLKFASDRDNMVTRGLRDAGLFGDSQYRNELSFTLEGGSIDIDADGQIAPCILGKREPREAIGEDCFTRQMSGGQTDV